VNCYECDRPATNACKRCSRTYCEDHGNATYCATCLQPSSALPSFNLYRAALLTTVTASADAPTEPAAESTPDPEATESPFNEYTVQDGDTLYDIAVANLPPGDDPVSFAEAIANLNQIDIDNPVLTPGQVLALPRGPAE
jgi:Tfp pilus assembly protein FimV